jgi:Undecaprenyl-phosphate glucose phosphotransferase
MFSALEMVHPVEARRVRLSPRRLLVISCAVEFAVIFGAGWLTALLSRVLPGGGEGPSEVVRSLPFILAVAASYCAVGTIIGAYPKNQCRINNLLLNRVAGALGAVLICLVTLRALPDQWPVAGTIWALLWFVIGFAGLGGARYGFLLLTANVVRIDLPKRPAIIVGSGESAVKLIETANADLASEVEFLGFFDDRSKRLGPLEGRLPFLGTLDDLVSYVQDSQSLDVFMALPWSAGSRISFLLDRLRFLPMTVRLVPEHPLPAIPGRSPYELDGVVMPTLMVPPFPPFGAAVKEAFDVVAGSLILLAISPILLVVALLIKLDSPGPVFFLQPRLGQYGRLFHIVKFRSMHAAQLDVEVERQVTARDRRVTRVGRYIRKYSLDELPQLFNVVMRDMSLVGPRPHAPKTKADGRFFSEIIPDYAVRYRVKPGMTGWAQVNGWRGETDTVDKLTKRVEFDFEYVRNWSFAWDLWILLLTIPAMLMPKNSH